MFIVAAQLLVAVSFLLGQHVSAQNRQAIAVPHGLCKYDIGSSRPHIISFL
jgi:hypothetical protein